MLVNYGIQNEDSDLRAHVSVCNATVYVFPTENGRKAIAENNIQGKPAYTGTTVTAFGYPVPFRKIANIQAVKIPQWIFENENFLHSDTTSQKGNKAVNIVKTMILKGLIQIALTPTEITEKTMQIKGTDIHVTANCKIQDKCDWRAGETGNVYLQVAERNLYKQF